MSLENMEPSGRFVNGELAGPTRRTPQWGGAGKSARDPLVELLDSRSERAPLRPLAIQAQGEIAAGAVGTESQRLADRFGATGLQSGAVVGLVAANGAAFVAAFAALRRCGWVVLLMDVGMPSAEQERVLERMGASAVVTAHDRWSGSAWSAQARLERLSPSTPLSSPGTAVLKLTSGSTGEPRGIAVRSEALLADGRALWKSMGLRADDRCLALVPMSHSYGFSVLAMPAFLGDTALVIPGDDDPLLIASRMGASVLPSTPAWFRALTRSSSPPEWPESLRLLLSAGAPLPARVAAEFRARFGSPIHAFYGASESGGICYDRRGDAAERGSVGTPVAGVRLEIQGEGESEGVVCARSAAVADGYFPRIAQSGNPLSAGAYRTDDIGKLENGELFLTARLGDWINVRGKKVNPREVEAILALLPGVEESAVVAHMTPNADSVVRAIIACPAGALSYRRVLDWCRPRIANHKLPRSVVFVDALPRNARGKVDRAALHNVGSDGSVAR